MGTSTPGGRPFPDWPPGAPLRLREERDWARILEKCIAERKYADEVCRHAEADLVEHEAKYIDLPGETEVERLSRLQLWIELRVERDSAMHELYVAEVNCANAWAQLDKAVHAAPMKK